MTNEIWEYGENPKGVFTNEIVVRPVGEFPHGEWIADCGPNSSENISKARLIAASPDMLGASPRAVKMLRIAAQLIADSTAVDHSIFYDDAECDGYCVIEDCEAAADELEAAIAKAKGETT